MKVLSKADILAAEDLPKELVEVPEWSPDGEPAGVYVRTLTGAEKDDFESSIIRVRQNGKSVTRETVMTNVRAKLLARCIVDEGGERLFTDSEIDQLGAKSAKALDRLFGVAQRLNAMGEDDIEELVGNSEPDPSDTSSSRSASGSGSRTPAFSSTR